MTRLEAESELAALEPKEVEAWESYARIVNLRDEDIKRHEDAVRNIRSASDKVLVRLNADWVLLHARKQQLKSFLEISG